MQLLCDLGPLYYKHGQTTCFQGQKVNINYFSKLFMSLNPKITKNIIIGIGLVSSLTALLMILKFAGLMPNFLSAISFSNPSLASVAETLTGFAQGLAGKLAMI